LLDGKEGVDGSSPSEGLKFLEIAIFCCLNRRNAAERYGEGHVVANLQELVVQKRSKTALREL